MIDIQNSLVYVRSAYWGRCWCKSSVVDEESGFGGHNTFGVSNAYHCVRRGSQIAVTFPQNRSISRVFEVLYSTLVGGAQGFPQKIAIWVNKVNRMICVWVRMWRMEKVPGHGLCTCQPPGRPAGQSIEYPSIISLVYPRSFIENRSLVDFQIRNVH